MSRLTVTVIAWNEEERLRACLESVAWADEIVVVDAESADKTVQIAREFTDDPAMSVTMVRTMTERAQAKLGDIEPSWAA